MRLQQPRTLRVLTSALMISILMGCSLSDIVGEPQTNESQPANPDAVKSHDGAIALYHGVQGVLTDAVAEYVRHSGLISDELRSALNFGGNNSTASPLDIRRLNNTTYEIAPFVFGQLQKVRANARQARGIIKTYAADGQQNIVGHLYAQEAFADILLAELYCSGIPLSTVDYQANYTLLAGSTTEQVFQMAVSLFDSALSLTTDSADIRYYAQIGKARALLNLGEYNLSRSAVAGVPDNYAYKVHFIGANRFQRSSQSAIYEGFLVSDGEGINGLRYATEGDVRTDTVGGIQQPNPVGPFRFYVAKKYSDLSGKTPFIIASGIEARLMEAEASLQENDIAEWLRILNELRTTCTAETFCPTPAPSGTGGFAGLGLLSDPGISPLSPGISASDARIDLMFKERAYWLFLTGHRQGDMRRLIRNYKRTQDRVYPTGIYPSTAGNTTYGTSVNLMVPIEEEQRNPKFKGCFNRGA